MSEILTPTTSCPLGHKCKSIKDNQLYVCAWLLTVEGIHPQTGDNVKQEQCAVVAQAMLTMDSTKASHGTTQSVATLTNILLNENTSKKYQRLIG